MAHSIKLTVSKEVDVNQEDQSAVSQKDEVKLDEERLLFFSYIYLFTH